ncbi:MAG: carbonate dehydratase [Bacteroidetes bacterium]|nr:carbonate dehydratase [Bacteroidota bacterium]
MRKLESLFVNNKNWAKTITDSEPDFFKNLSKQQAPQYLWIGCSDSRVPANEIVGLAPGEVFVHRNIANLVIHTDLNCLSVIQFAVEILKIKHIIVCGHYGCGGVRAALDNNNHGLIDNWLQHIKDIYRYYKNDFDGNLPSTEKYNLLCELNVIEQVTNVCHTTIVQNAWKEGHELTVHGWIYDIGDGILNDLEISISGLEETDQIQNIVKDFLEKSVSLKKSKTQQN